MVTRKDVAKRAGVSVTVVSRTLNNSGYVAKEKREAVLQAAQELGYRPNPMVLSMQNNKTRQILFYNKDLGNAYTIALYRGMIKYASTRDYMIVLSGTLDFSRVRTMMFDGIILPNEFMAKRYAQALGGYQFPTVSIAYEGTEKNPNHIPFILTDTYDAVEALIIHLRKKGHELIAFATPYNLMEYHSRHVAYITHMRPVLKDRLEEFVISQERSENEAFLEENFSEEGAFAAREFDRRQNNATAIICFNDEFAIGMCSELQKLGYRIPEDISIVGIDGLDSARFMNPQLTTVDINPFEQGIECVRVLLDLIEGKRAKSLLRIPIQLVEGSSVKDIRTDKNSKR